jgi:tRNA dimethylallyltransferase
MINPSQKYLVVIAGPTAVGKTKLAIKLAKHYSSVILSADSRQFYMEMNIGTAKPTEEELGEVTHYFINSKHVSELYGAGDFERDALQLLGTLFEQHNIIFMVGGSGLYINAVLNGVDDLPAVPHGLREELNKKTGKLGIEWLREELKKHDEKYFSKVDINNPQRMIRALEVYLHTGKPYSSFLSGKSARRNFTPVKIFLNVPRQELYEKINKRVDEMMKAGLLDEVKDLVEHKNFNALKTVGYSELYDYLENKCDLDAAVEKIKQHTRNYAKRQITWFKHQDEYEEFHPLDVEKIKAYIDIIMAHG